MFIEYHFTDERSSNAISLSILLYTIEGLRPCSGIIYWGAIDIDERNSNW